MNDQKISKENIINLYQMGFEYSKDRHAQLLSKISEIRNVANYIVTGVVAFTGFILSSNLNTLLITTFQKAVFYLIFFAIICIWLRMSWAIKVPVGFNPGDLVKTIKEFNNSDYREIKTKCGLTDDDPEIGIYEYILQIKSNEYVKAESLLSGEIENLRKVLISLSGVFFLICILFILIPNLNITF